MHASVLVQYMAWLQRFEAEATHGEQQLKRASRLATKEVQGLGPTVRHRDCMNNCKHIYVAVASLDVTKLMDHGMECVALV